MRIVVPLSSGWFLVFYVGVSWDDRLSSEFCVCICYRDQIVYEEARWFYKPLCLCLSRFCNIFGNIEGGNTLDRPVVPLHMLLQKEDLHLAHTSGVFVSTVSPFLIDSRKVCTTLKQEMYGCQNHNLPLPS